MGQCYRLESKLSNDMMQFSRKDSVMYAQQNSSLSDSTFKAVPGMDSTISGGVSFESTSVPGRFLRHWSENKVSLHATNTINIEKDSTFVVKPSESGVMLEASNEPQSFLVEEFGRVTLHKQSEADGFENKATWVPIKVQC